VPPRRVGADRAGRVAAEPELGERRVEGVEQEESAGERVADAEKELQDLIRLEQAHDPGHDAEDAGHRAAGSELGRRRGRVEAAVARAVERLEHRELALEPVDRGVDDGDPGEDRRVVQRVARLELVGPVEDDVVSGDDLDVGVGEHLLVGDDLHVGFRALMVCRPTRPSLSLPGRSCDDLALEVRQVDDVEVDDADRPDARRGEVEGGGLPSHRRR
jgi:hypothetical protein